MHWGHTPGLLPSVGGMQGSRTLTRLLGWVFLAGFTCFYKRRTGCKTDGCAVCYKPTRFRLLCASPVEYFRPGLELLNRDNVGLVLLLQPLVPEGLGQVSVAPLCVANTHVLYNPRRGDVKLAQKTLLQLETAFNSADEVDMQAYLDSSRDYLSKGFVRKLGEFGASHPMTPKRIEALELFVKSASYFDMLGLPTPPDALDDVELAKSTEKILSVL